MMNRAEYNEMMAKIAEGGKVSQKTFDELTEFAKAKKTKRPPADAVIDETAVKEAATTAKGTPAEKPAKAKKAAKAKEPKVKAKCSVKGCDKPARAGGMCSTDYSRLIYRAKPENAEKARVASRNYAAKVRAAKAEAKAKEQAKEKASSAA